MEVNFSTFPMTETDLTTKCQDDNSIIKRSSMSLNRESLLHTPRSDRHPNTHISIYIPNRTSRSAFGWRVQLRMDMRQRYDLDGYGNAFGIGEYASCCCFSCWHLFINKPLSFLIDDVAAAEIVLTKQIDNLLVKVRYIGHRKCQTIDLVPFRDSKF